MDLICPNCQKRLSLEDKFAGMTVRCPLCQGMFQAPALPPAALEMTAPPQEPPPSPPSTMPTESTPSTVPTRREPTVVLTPSDELPQTADTQPDNQPLRTAVPLPYSDEPALEPEPLETPTIPQGDYTRGLTMHLRQDVLSWFPPVCVTLLFILSLFPWYWIEVSSANLWQLAFTFTEVNMYTFYVIVLIFIAWPLAILVFILEQRWLPLPAALRPLWPWRSVFVGMAIFLPFVFFLGDYVMAMFRSFGNPATIAMKLAIRIHFLAVLACAFQFWLEQRRSRNLPLPRMEMKW
jgi:hypothetical protein